MVCLLAGTRFTKSLVLFGGWQAACRLDCYKIQTTLFSPEDGTTYPYEIILVCESAGNPTPSNPPPRMLFSRTTQNFCYPYGRGVLPSTSSRRVGKPNW
jgi:hypothetical protein